MKWKPVADRSNVLDFRGDFGATTEEDRRVVAIARESMSSEDIAAFAKATGWPANWEPIVSGSGYSTMLRRRNPNNSWSFAPATPEDLFGADDAGEGVAAIVRSPRRFD